jgi:protein SCO1
LFRHLEGRVIYSTLRVSKPLVIISHHSSGVGRLFVLFIAFALFGGCSSLRRSPSERYPIAGKIISIDQSKNQIVVSHAEIKGYMPSMVMPFQLKTNGQVATLAKGDEITAILVVSGQETWLEELRVLRRGATDARDLEISSLPREGDSVPDFTLVNQNGKRISLKQYRGKALLITFIYTRCPLPDYCPLMSANFATIDKALQDNPALYGKTHLLSISFDSEYDTPAVLRSYGAAYTERYIDEKFGHWEFASGSTEEVKAITKFFGLQYASQSDQIVHSLVTAIITPDGKVFKVYPHNDWKATDLLRDLQAMKL